MKRVKQIVMMAFASLLAQCVWAAAPIVSWGAGEVAGDATKNGYTLKLGGGAANVEGGVKVTGNTQTYTGLEVNWEDGTYTDTKMTVVVDYKDFAKQSANYALMGIQVGTSREVLAAASGPNNTIGESVADIGGGHTQKARSGYVVPTAGTLVVSLDRTAKTFAMGFLVDGVLKITHTDVIPADFDAEFKKICISGAQAGSSQYYRPTMTITGVAIYGVSYYDVVNEITPVKAFPPFLTTDWQDTGWKVNSVNDLLRYSYVGKMSGSSVSNKPVNATGFHVTKHTDSNTVSVELQAVNGETKTVRAMFKVVDGRVYVKGGPVGWKATNTPLGARFFTVAGAATSGTTTRTLATAAGSADYGIYDLMATPSYVASNALINNNQSNYPGKTYTLNIPAIVGYPLGTIVNVSSIGIGVTSANDATGVKVKILDGTTEVATSSSRSAYAVDATISGGWFRHSFEGGVDLQVGKNYTIQFLDNNGAEITGTLRFRLTTNAADANARSAISVSGDTTYRPITEIIGTYKTASATIVTLDFTKDYGKTQNKWWSDLVGSIKKGGQSTSWSDGSDILFNVNGYNAFLAGRTYGNSFVNGSLGDTMQFTGADGTGQGTIINKGYFAVPTLLGTQTTLNDIDEDSAPITFYVNNGNHETPDALETAMKNKELMLTFRGSTSNYNNVNIGASVNYQLKSHLIFEGGQNKMTLGSSQEKQAMSLTGTLDNPTILVKSGTLDYTMKDMNGWNGGRCDNTIVRVANGATLNFLPNSNSSMFMSGRLVLEPGSTTTYKTGNESHGFCVYGGINVDKAQIYVPSPTGDVKVATLTKAEGSQKNLKFAKSSGTGGAAITVEDGAMLKMDTPIEGDQNFTKGGAGTLKLMQAVTSSGYTGTATINAGTIEFAAGENSMKLAAREMNGLLQVDKGATYTAQASDVPNYGTAGSVAVYGTLDMANYRWTMGTDNKTYVYAGGLIKGTGDGNGSILDFYQNNATIYGKKFDGAAEQVATISGPLNLQQDVTFDVEEDVTLKITGQKRLPNQKSFTKTGSGALELSGEWQGGTGNFYNLTINGGTLAYDLGAGNERALCINNFSNSGTVKVLSGTLYREVSARDLSGLNLGTIECAEGAAFEIRAKMTPAECTAKTAKFTGIPEGVTLKLMAGNELVTLERQADGTATYTSDHIIIDGTACLYDFVFDNTVSTTKGSINKATLNIDGGVTVSYVNGGITAQSRPWMDINFQNLDKFTVGVVATMPTSKKTTVVFLGDSVHDGNFGLHLATGSEENQVEINYVTSTEVKNITTMKVPNASTARHVYTISKVEARKFVIYLDGVQWKTVATDYDIVIKGGGIQIGSDHGGRLKDNGIYSAATTVGGGVFNVLRIYDRLLTKEEQQTYASAFPYTDPNGTSSRTLTAATEDWALTETTPWSYKANASADPVAQATATANGAIDLTVNSEENAVKAEINLDADVSYTSFTIRGNKPVTFDKTDGKTGKISATAAVTIGGDVKIVHGALDISGSPVTMGDGAKLDFDCSDVDISGIFETTYIGLTGDMEENAGVTVSVLPTAANRTAALVYNAGQYAIKVTVSTVDLDIPVVEHATATATINGTAATITENNKITVPCNANLVITYAAETGYHLGAKTQITANDVTSETTLSAEGIEAIINTYTVTITAVENATAKYNDETVEGSISVNHGTDVTITYVANTNYKLVDSEGETVDGVCALGVVTGDVATAPTFTAVLDVVTITIPTAPANTVVKVTVNGTEVEVVNNSITATIGAKVVVTYSAAEGYIMDDVATTLTAGSSTEIAVPTAAPVLAVAQVGTKLYPTLQAALDGVAAEATVTLLADISADARIVYTGTPAITLDLNGKKITSTADVALINKGGAMTITGEGTIDASNATDPDNDCVWAHSGNITILNGTFINKSTTSATVYLTNAAVITIEGGTFKNLSKTFVYGTTTETHYFGVLNVNNKSAVSQLVVKGGTFVGTDPAKGDDNLGGTFVADGYESVKSDVGNNYIVQVKLMPEEPTVDKKGDLVIPTPTGAATVEVSVKGEKISDGKIPLTDTGLYTVMAKNANGEVIAESQIGVVVTTKKTGTEENKPTVAVAVPFKGATVANLLDTTNFADGDQLKAFINGAYAMWTFKEGKWTSGTTVLAEGLRSAPNADTTPLARGSAVWVTTEADVVAFGAYTDEAVEPEVTAGYNLIGNPMMTKITPEAKTVGDILIPIGGTELVRYTVIDKGNGAKAWQCTKSVPVSIPGLSVDGSEEKTAEEDPTVQVGGSVWLIK